MKLLIDVGTSQDAADAVGALVKSKLGRDLTDFIQRNVKYDQSWGKHVIVRLTDDTVNCGYPETYANGYETYTRVSFSELFFNPSLLEPDLPTRFKLNEEYTAVISHDRKAVTVGCQKFPSSVVLKLAELLK